MSEHVILDFYSEGCAPCRAARPAVKLAKEKLPQVEFRDIDASANGELCDRYRIKSVPTLIYLRDGEEMRRISGVPSARDIVEMVDVRAD